MTRQTRSYATTGTGTGRAVNGTRVATATRATASSARTRGRRFSSSRAAPAGAKGFGGNNDCGLRKSLRKEVVFAVGKCMRKRKDGSGRLGVARPGKVGRGRQGEVCPDSGPRNEVVDS
jgi:hypothetical protein